MLVRCEACGVEFEKLRRLDGKHYCSRKCGTRAGAHQKKLCVVCSAEFRSNAGNQKCCSSDCVHRWSAIKTKRSYEQQRSTSRTTGTCKHCHKQFEYHYRPDRGKREFCGRSCASKHYIATGAFDAWRHRKNDLQPRFIVNCAQCGKEKRVLQRELDEHVLNDMVHCCDSKCRIEYTRSVLTGRPGHAFTEQMRDNQVKTMTERYGVTNAFMLATRRIKTKPQTEIYEFLQSVVPDSKFEIEKLITEHGKKLFADIVSFSLKLIIEFNGDYWHCNPRTYDAGYLHEVKGQTAQQIWAADADRLNVFRAMGYSVYVIWETEFREHNWQLPLMTWVEEETCRRTRY